MKGAALDRGLTTAGRCAAAMASTLGGRRLSILIFHRVLAQPDPLFPEEIDAARFERLMALLAATFKVLPLDQAAEHLVKRELPRRALAITFDDGYADNHDMALPILQRHGLTATFFVATGFVDGGRMWNDTVIECLRRTTLTKVDLNELGLGEVPTQCAAERRAAINLLLPKIKYQAPALREPLLRTLHAACGAPALPNNLMMRSDQVRGLHEAGMGVGAHTVHHPILCSLSDAEAEHEMSESRSILEALIAGPVTTFAYPNGRLGQDYEARHAVMAKRLGFTAAVSTNMGASRPGNDLHQLKRFTPWDRDARRWMTRLLMHHIRG